MKSANGYTFTKQSYQNIKQEVSKHLHSEQRINTYCNASLGMITYDCVDIVHWKLSADCLRFMQNKLKCFTTNFISAKLPPVKYEIV